jgi:hypothetical protein
LKLINKEMGTDNGTKKSRNTHRKFVTELVHPRLFAFLVVAHLLLTFAGFAPSVFVFRKRGRWWLNPVRQPEEWANDNNATMKAHTFLSLLWLVVSLLQYVVTPAIMVFRPPDNGAKKKSSSPATIITTDHQRLNHLARMLHKVIGYAAVCLLTGFVLNANYLTIINGVAGKVHYNFIALITGSMMMWHLIRAILAIRQKDIRSHINQVCGLLCWSCFPGIARAVALLPYQYFFLPEECDVTSTSGIILGTSPVSIMGLMSLRWAATGGETRLFFNGEAIIQFFTFSWPRISSLDLLTIPSFPVTLTGRY